MEHKGQISRTAFRTSFWIVSSFFIIFDLLDSTQLLMKLELCNKKGESFSIFNLIT